jgi:hypothetical protein
MTAPVIAVADQRLRAQARNRGGGDNAAAALPLHVRGGQADGHEGRGEVHIDRAPEQGEVQRLDRAVRRKLEAGAGGDSGIGEHDVEAAVALRGSVDGRAQPIAVADIDDSCLHGAARRRKPCASALEPGRIGIGEHHASAVLGHHRGIGEPEPAGGAGDEGDMAVDVEQLRCFHFDSVPPPHPPPQAQGHRI